MEATVEYLKRREAPETKLELGVPSRTYSWIQTNVHSFWLGGPGGHNSSLSNVRGTSNPVAMCSMWLIFSNCQSNSQVPG